MMLDHLLISTVTAPLALVASVLFLADRLRPAVAVIVFTGAAVTAATSSMVSVAAIIAYAGVAGVRGDRFTWTSWVALGFLTVIAVLLVRRAVRERRSYRAARELAAALPGDDPVVFAPGEVAQAYSVPGRPGRIVVSEAMLRALSDEDRAAVVEHERAHLAKGHHVWLAASRLAISAHPLLWPVRPVIAYVVERWADERAATRLGNRVQVARAIGAAALVGSPASPGNGFLGGRRGVPQRISALLAPLPPMGYAAFLIIPALCTAGSLAWTGEVLIDLSELIRAKPGDPKCGPTG
ncbi:M56 family metallopeptidase [Acrocarpospora sp. B8E8]|uniref:M56 family metallopeptidase n=1 Tax=Acrocarpospora sp. B8E8 TaxID=3153572 RepID=UPI00325E53D0